VGTAHHQEAASTEARPTAAIRAGQELGKTKGVPEPELGNGRKGKWWAAPTLYRLAQAFQPVPYSGCVKICDFTNNSI